MPISHIMSDSFYEEREEAEKNTSTSASQQRQWQMQRLARNKSLPAAHFGRSSSRTSRVSGLATFDEDERYFDDELYKDSGMDSTIRGPEGLGTEPSSQHSPSYEISFDDKFYMEDANNEPDHHLVHDFANIDVGKGKDFDENPVLIDTDGSIYGGAWALALAFTATKMKNFQIVGITTVNGGTTTGNAVANVSRIMQETGTVPIPYPLFKGMESSIVGKPGSTPKPSFFGSDGFGDPKNLPSLLVPPIIEKEHGVNAIIKLAERYKGRLTVLTFGPLTNLAMAVRLKPEIRNYIKEIFIVGGNMEGVGNMTVTSEFNFFVDPEAASIVLESFHSCPIYLLPWEIVSSKMAASSHDFRTNTIGTIRSPLVNLFNRIEEVMLKKHAGHWIAHDAVMMACFLNQKVIRKTENYHCTVELQGKNTRGLMIVDKNFLMQNPANVIIITEIDRNEFEKMLMEALSENRDNFGESKSQQSHYEKHQQGFGIKERRTSRTPFKIEQNHF